MNQKYVASVLFTNKPTLVVECPVSREGLDAAYRVVEPFAGSEAWHIVHVKNGVQVDVVDARY